MKKNVTNVMFAALAGMVLLAGCGQKQQSLPAANFKTMKVEAKTVTLESKYSATIRGRQDIDVYPQVGGTLQALRVTEGQKVKKGQVMFVIDQVPYIAALNTAKAALEAATSAVTTAQSAEATAKLSYESKKALHEQKVVSDFDLQTARNSWQSAQAQVKSAQAQVAQAKAQLVNAQNSLSYTEVKSPADGVVGTLPFRQGALVGPSMPVALTTVSDNSRMYVYFSVNEARLLEMTRESGSIDSAIMKMPDVKLQLVDGTMYGTTGRVESVSGVVDRSTGSVQMRAAFDNAQGLLHSGSTGNVIMPVEMKDCLVIPSTATVQAQDKFRVYVVDKDGIAKERIVKLHPQTVDDERIVLSDLKAGEEIVSEGAGMVKEGQKVKGNPEPKKY
ncbi:MAG: efflux RND transporter periplasmic adaptor subunit [Bacteroidaceae bacterium]|nr:efflux RND transporter periplasmic adaptor subunit [Bacteroidaceae bacterium]